MSTQAIIDEINAYTDDSPAEAVETDALSLMEYALTEAMATLGKDDQEVVTGLVMREIIYRMKRRQQEQAA